MTSFRGALRRSLLTCAAVATLAGSAGVANAQRMPPPPGWAGPHYYWHGHHWHHRAWAYDRFHHRYRRYY